MAAHPDSSDVEKPDRDPSADAIEPDDAVKQQVVLFRRVAARPGMFIPGTYETLDAFAAYFSGYDAGLRQLKPGDSLDFLFSEWLGRKWNVAPNMHWATHIRHRYPNDKEAIQAAMALLEQCVAETGGKSPSHYYCARMQPDVPPPSG